MLLPLFTDVSVSAWVLALLAAFMIGISKAGLKGLSLFNVTLLALAFGAKASTGIIMPFLVLGDIAAVLYYSRHAQWKPILKILPWMALGILTGVILGKDLPERLFKVAMVTIIFVSLGLLVFWDIRKSKTVPRHWTFASGSGILAGLTTMIGNMAGPFTNLYFLMLRLPKNEFVGTAAWLFFITNLFKVPFHVFVWKTISAETLVLNLKLFPALLLGFVVGAKVLKFINDSLYRKFILVVTAIGAIAILLK
ncbi:sulfite exporter TauE/SafE family protein [Muricauda sp. SCSIO 64092]|uniref:sulfite exporter TauE/SafE family protein n=1 Tax=Allomuricauda sp. SCSIO 64092 TaxID=2908842 RepID=UPI001FF21421|nr:sulfite exporter TauE/SafE family protein [Muricauda sp. SCSIO 64092]UOY09013.1 sulfite exporter TauE/SafE family protein [Muricauda sp. SCSIO 64092]